MGNDPGRTPPNQGATTLKAPEIDQVQPGMTLAYPINHGNFLVGKGAVLTASLIFRLRNVGVGHLCVV